MHPARLAGYAFQGRIAVSPNLACPTALATRTAECFFAWVGLAGRRPPAPRPRPRDQRPFGFRACAGRGGVFLWPEVGHAKARYLTPTLNEAAAVVAARPLRQAVAAVRSLSRSVAVRPLSQPAAARSLRRVSRGLDVSPFVRGARADVRAVPPDARAAAPYLRSALASMSARQSAPLEAAAGRPQGAGQAAAGLGMPRRAPKRTRSVSV